MLSQCQRDLVPRMLETTSLSITPILSKVFEKIMAESGVIFWKVTV